MNNAVLVVLVAIAAVASGVAIGMLVLRKEDPVRADLIEWALAAVARTVGQSLGDAEIRAVAAWVYDILGVSAYYSKEDWIAYCVRMLRQADVIAQAAPSGLVR